MPAPGQPDGHPHRGLDRRGRGYHRGGPEGSRVGMTEAKVAAITGGSSGIGRATAKLFASEGWRVYNLSRRAADEPGVIDIPVDVTQDAAVRSAFAQIREDAGQLDLLVNN